jgi:hypothetical protein
MSMLRIAITLATSVAVCACGDDTEPGAADATPDSVDARSGDASSQQGPGFVPDRVGFVNIIEGSWYIDNGDGFEVLRAVVNDAPAIPRASVAAIGGGCGVYTHADPGFCDPACTDGHCTTEGTCVPFPSNVDVGGIDVSGLRTDFTFEPTDFGYEYPDFYPVSSDLFEDGAEIAVAAAGADAPGFSLSARGVPDVESDMTDRLGLEAATSESFTWTPLDTGRIQIGMRYGWHGIPYQVLVICETDDTGAFDVPADIVDAYIDEAGSGEVNYWWIARFDRDVVTTPAGPIELFVGAIDYHPQLL